MKSKLRILGVMALIVWVVSCATSPPPVQPSGDQASAAVGILGRPGQSGHIIYYVKLENGRIPAGFSVLSSGFFKKTIRISDDYGPKVNYVLNLEPGEYVLAGYQVVAPGNRVPLATPHYVAGTVYILDEQNAMKTLFKVEAGNLFTFGTISCAIPTYGNPDDFQLKAAEQIGAPSLKFPPAASNTAKLLFGNNGPLEIRISVMTVDRKPGTVADMRDYAKRDFGDSAWAKLLQN